MLYINIALRVPISQTSYFKTHCCSFSKTEYNYFQKFSKCL